MNLFNITITVKWNKTWSFILYTTCFWGVFLENIPKGVALRFRRICNSDEKFEKHSTEYQNYLIARDYKPGKVKKQFSDIKKLTREEARKPKLLKTTLSTSCNLITQYNSLLPNLKTIIRKHLPILYSNQQMLDIFPHNTTSVTYKRNKNLREILWPSLFLKTTKQKKCYIKKCNKKCDICKNFLVVSPDFTCFATKQKYKIKGILKCDSRNVIYLISCKCCGKQYVGSATGFKERFRIHKSDISTGKIRCGVANHLLNVCRSSTSKFEYFQVQLIEKVSVKNDEDIDKVLWERKK